MQEQAHPDDPPPRGEGDCTTTWDPGGCLFQPRLTLVGLVGEGAAARVAHDIGIAGLAVIWLTA
eukprot:6491172-Lingulodinium_polyedra.AAC.1